MKMSATPETVKMAEEALQCQDACNSGGVTHLLSRITTQLHQHPDYAGTDWISTNPIRIVILDKLCSLSNIQNFDSHEINEAYLLVSNNLVAGHEAIWGKE